MKKVMLWNEGNGAEWSDAETREETRVRENKNERACFSIVYLNWGHKGIREWIGFDEYEPRRAFYDEPVKCSPPTSLFSEHEERAGRGAVSPQRRPIEVFPYWIVPGRPRYWEMGGSQFTMTP